MSRNRRSLARDLRAAATAHQPEPDPQFVDRLGRRLAGLDAADADAGTTGSNVVAFGRRLSRGAAIGLVAAVISAAGAAAVALVAVHHDSPPPTTTVPATTATTEPIRPSPVSGPTTTNPAPSTTTTSTTTTTVSTAAAQTSTTASPPATDAATATTIAPATSTTLPARAPATTEPTSPPTSAATPPATDATDVITDVPSTTPAPPPTDAPTTTEQHVPATLSLSCAPTGSSIACSWGAVPDGTDHVVLLRSTPSESRGRVLSPAAGSSSYDDGAVTTGEPYTYLLHALDAAGHSLGHSGAVTIGCCG